MMRYTLSTLLSAALLAGCTSTPAKIQPETTEALADKRIMPACIQLADGLHCQVLVPASKAEPLNRQRVPGILL